MPLVVNQNIPAITAYGDLATTRENLSKAIEKFSTGLRVNSAADDAAGLAVSEKLRAQMGGIDQAIDNVQDGISLIQTADGALSETQDILHRMRELSVQSANGTLTAQDRSYIQFEINELREEITRIANTTQFNKKKLLNGEAAAHWSSDKTTTKAIIRGGLQDVDQFGQKTSFEGNYKIDIEAIPGQGTVMKTKIFTSLEDVDFFTYVGSGNYRNDANEPRSASEAAQALKGYYNFSLYNKKNGKFLSVGLLAEEGQFSSMEKVAEALNDGALEGTEYTAYFDSKAGALAIRAMGHDFDVKGRERDLNQLFGVNFYGQGTVEDDSVPLIDVVIPSTPTVPTPPSVDHPGSYTTTNAAGEYVMNTESLTYKHTYNEDEAVVNITESGVYKINGNHDSITVADGVKATIVLDHVTVTNVNDKTTASPTQYGDAAFSIGKDAEVDLALVQNTTLTSGNGRAGIEVEGNSTLRIYNNTSGNGKLTAKGGYYAAAIGGSGNLGADPREDSPVSIEHNAGNIIIYSGNITAKATTRWRDDIGNYNYDYGLDEDGNPTSPDYPYGYDDFGGAGIGGGRYGSASYIAIHGGTVTAEGSFGGAGIGSGRIGYPGQESAANILITGGDITATSHAGGAGIGGGSGSEYIRTKTGGYAHNEFVYLDKNTASYGTITITGGTIHATGGDGGYNNRGGAGIGGGEYNIGGEILITGGNITAYGGHKGGAGIGGGAGSPAVNPELGNGGKITIIGGDVTATGRGSSTAGEAGWTAGAGIGGGDGGTAGEILITGGTINATGGNANLSWAHSGGAGIGAGADSGRKVGNEIIVNQAGKIYILDGNVTATGGFNAAGIGGGGTDTWHAYNCGSGGGLIVIAGGNVTAQGGVSGAGVGGGSKGESGAIRIQEGLTVNAKAGGNNFSDYTPQGNGSQYHRERSEGLQENIGHGDHIRELSDVLYGRIRLLDPGNVVLTPPSRGNYTELVQRVAEPDTPLSTLLELKTDAGEPLLTDPQTVTINRGDGTQSRFTLYPDDDMNSMAQKLNTAIAGVLGSTSSTGYQTGALVGQLVTSSNIGAGSNNMAGRFVSYVAPGENIGNTVESVDGTMVVRSLPCGIDGVLAFEGSKEILEALGMNTIQEARENQFIVNITDAHTGEVVAKDVHVIGNKLNGVLHENVDIEWDAMAGIEVRWNDDKKTFEYITSKYTTYLHLVDNTTVLQVGANEGEDLALSIGDMSAHALGLDAVNVMGRESAARAITLIDNANDKVSTQRARLGAYQNRLERTIGSLSTASVNLTQADSRIRDTDMAREAMNFAKLQIIFQSGTSMLTQANQLPQHVMSLMR